MQRLAFSAPAPSPEHRRLSRTLQATWSAALEPAAFTPETRVSSCDRVLPQHRAMRRGSFWWVVVLLPASYFFVVHFLGDL